MTLEGGSGSLRVSADDTDQLIDATISATVPAVSIGAGDDFVGRPREGGIQQNDDYTAHRYHQPSDAYRPEANLEGAVQLSEIVMRFARHLANAPATPTWNRDAEFRALRPAAQDRSDEVRKATLAVIDDLKAGVSLLKILRRDSESAKARFVVEAQITGQLEHPSEVNSSTRTGVRFACVVCATPGAGGEVKTPNKAAATAKERSCAMIYLWVIRATG